MRRLLRVLLWAVLGPVLGFLLLCTGLLLVYSFANPPITGVQLQRQIGAWIEGTSYDRRYRPVSRDEVSDHLRHALVAAEDNRFYDHGGIDWKAVQKAIDEARQDGRGPRGASTITQQLVKNLFLTTHRSIIRKALEVPLTYLAELILSKQRILDLYLNVIEWDAGVYGAEAASQRYFGRSAADLTRTQAATLAAIVPAPLRRSPNNVGWYRDIIMRRMNQLGY